MDRSRPGQEASWPVQNPKIQLAPNPLAYGFVGAVLNGLPAYQWPVKHPFRLPDVYYQRFYKNVNAGWVLVTRYFVCPPPPSTPDDPRYPANGIAYFETEEQAWTMAHYYRQLNLTYPRRAEMVRFDGSLRLQLVNIARTMKCMDIFQGML